MIHLAQSCPLTVDLRVNLRYRVSKRFKRTSRRLKTQEIVWKAFPQGKGQPRSRKIPIWIWRRAWFRVILSSQNRVQSLNATLCSKWGQRRSINRTNSPLLGQRLVKRAKILGKLLSFLCSTCCRKFKTGLLSNQPQKIKKSLDRLQKSEFWTRKWLCTKNWTSESPWAKWVAAATGFL